MTREINEQPEAITVQTMERRKNKRHRIKSGIAALMLPDRSQIATIIDISTHGLSFVCQECEIMRNNQVEMDILLLDDILRPDNDIFFPSVRCTVVSAVSYTDPAAHVIRRMTRCSVRFNTLIPLESFSLRRFSFPGEKPEACAQKSRHG
ncbi:MAG: PilZ domain-containing protein [Deltaproteobacteria bacterium]|nr:PilZ domain-containing protein [Deltaproteobacteria bacterium]